MPIYNNSYWHASHTASEAIWNGTHSQQDPSYSPRRVASQYGVVNDGTLRDLTGTIRNTGVAIRYVQLRQGLVNPNGLYDDNNHSIWYPDTSERRSCCEGITVNSRNPLALWNHCKSLEHVCTKYGVNREDVTREVIALLKRNKDGRSWWHPLDCPKCFNPMRDNDLIESQPPVYMSSLSEEARRIVASVRNLGSSSVYRREMYRYIRYYHCHCNGQNVNYLHICNNEIYRLNAGESRWVKLRGFHKHPARPTSIVHGCTHCGRALVQMVNKSVVSEGLPTDYLEKSDKFCCSHCRCGNHSSVFRFFSDGAIFVFSLDLHKWISSGDDVARPHRQNSDKHDHKTTSFLYRDRDSKLQRLLLHIKAKSDGSPLVRRKNLDKSLVPFKEVLEHPASSTDVTAVLEEVGYNSAEDV